MRSAGVVRVMRMAGLVAGLARGAHADPAPPAAPSSAAGPATVVATPPAKAEVKIPAVPVLAAPLGPGGSHGVLELIAMGAALRDTDLQVSGYVTWIYDCAAAIGRRGEARAATQRRIDRDPTLCERPKFYLGDAPDTPADRALWVVDAPRPFNKLERERIDLADRTPANYPDRCEPDPRRPRAPLCLPLAVGDYVTVSGRFAVASPHAERNSDGLIVFAALTPASPPSPPATVRPPVAPASPPLVVTAPPPQDISASARATSLRHLRAAAAAYGGRDYPRAEEACRDAVTAWPGNDKAWYILAGVYMARDDWSAADGAAARAFALAPSKVDYAVSHGFTSFHAAIAAAAAQQHLDPDDPGFDLAKVNLARTEQLMAYAVRLDPAASRAHYYLGRIAREQGRAQEAAAAFTRALASAPPEPAPWIALGELYRRWQRPDLAQQVIEQALQVVPTASTKDLWYVLGMAYDARGQDARAIEAFTRTLALDPRHAKALFQRGQARVRTRARTDARRDLEAFLALPGEAFARQAATALLRDLRR